VNGDVGDTNYLRADKASAPSVSKNSVLNGRPRPIWSLYEEGVFMQYHVYACSTKKILRGEKWLQY
jgi:hypothetical protein